MKKKLSFLAFILAASACELQNKTNTKYNNKPDKDPIPVPEPPIIQTTRDEWIQLIKGKSADAYVFDSAGNWGRKSTVEYKFCDVAEGQNKVIYSIQKGFVGFEFKDPTLIVFANNQNSSGVSPWSSSNDVSFDLKNPKVYTTYITLYMWRENNTSAQAIFLHRQIFL